MLAGVSAAALVWRRRFPYLFVGWFWYLGMLVPVIGLVQVGSQAMADRYTYLPQIGLCIAVAWGVVQACRFMALSSLGVRRRRGAGGAGPDGLCVAADVVLARQRDALDPRPCPAPCRNFVAHSNLGDDFAESGQVDAAIHSVSKGIGNQTKLRSGQL